MGILGSIKNLFQKNPETSKKPEEPEICIRLDRLGEDTLGRRVMLADYSASMREIYRNVLEENGYAVVAWTGSGNECLRLYRESRPDMVLMRVNNLYRQSGLEALVELIREEPSAKVVMCEQKRQVTKELVQQCIGLGAKDFIMLPFKNHRLLRSAHALCPNAPDLPPDVEAERAAAERAAQEAAKEAARKAGKMIMVDEPSLFPKNLQKALDENGYMTTSRERPNLTVLTIPHPELIKNLKNEDSSVKILVLAPVFSEEDKEEFLRLGADDYVTASVQPETFLKHVEALCHPSASPKPEDIKTPYSQKLAGMTTEELLAEMERITNMKVADTLGRILVVQKMESMQAAIQKTLEENHFTVTGTVFEGWRCLELYRETKPNLVIMDTVLADEIDGIKILQLIRKEDPSAQVLMTGLLEEDVVAACIQSGAKGFLANPFKPEDLLKEVRDIILR